jgi:hypothetical protein
VAAAFSGGKLSAAKAAATRENCRCGIEPFRSAGYFTSAGRRFTAEKL